MSEPQHLKPPQPRTVEGVDAAIVAALAWKLVGRDIAALLEATAPPQTFKPYGRRPTR